jgi:hypothetical protein
MNKYISKYSKYETHFNRTDQWKHVPWSDEEPELPLLHKVLGAVGFALCLVAIVII